MDKSPYEKSQYREMLNKNLGEESQTFKFQSTKKLLSSGSDEEQKNEEKDKIIDIQSKSTSAQLKDLINYKNLFYGLLFIIIGGMGTSLYTQNGEIGTLNSNVKNIKENLVKLEIDIGSIKEKYENNLLIQKDFEYIEKRLKFIENTILFSNN